MESSPLKKFPHAGGRMRGMMGPRQGDRLRTWGGGGVTKARREKTTEDVGAMRHTRITGGPSEARPHGGSAREAAKSRLPPAKDRHYL
ncbi:hypothetical protein AVEN_163361-1 [Araneus ventricosus]|uniref:Uncharacterized protein n=1 Tax=Araneus ventricosus TaxID=182803 RepID=A0A4Y2VHI0_ARAVE|nr:hypothetical protein AVEN_163361-1 [Araneus ventricosus]